MLTPVPLLAAHFTVALTTYRKEGSVALPHLSAAINRWAAAPIEDALLEDDGDNFPLPTPYASDDDDSTDSEPFLEPDDEDDPEASDDDGDDDGDSDDEDDEVISDPGTLHLGLVLTAEAFAEYQNYVDTCVGLHCVITYTDANKKPVFCHTFDCEGEAVLTHDTGETTTSENLEVSLCVVYEVAARFGAPAVARVIS